MKTNKLMKKLTSLFSRAKRREDKKRKELQDALLQLKKKQKELDTQLECCQDPEQRQALVEKINILKAQRGKGIGHLRNSDESSM